jgi:hypothetical protein
LSIKGFSVGGVVQRYDYTALDNLPQGQGVSDDLKAALLQLAQKVAYIDDQGQTYYDDLYDALYPEKTLLSITANFQQGQAVVYNTDSLDSLKQYLTVTAVYDDASTETVPSSAYTLIGTLTTGTSVITVTYEGKTDAFNVTVTAAPMSFAVTNTLTGCTTSNSATSVLENTSYTAVITASSGYTLVGATVSITMGGQDITTSAYSGGIISVNNVTGALVIAVSAVAVVLNSISAVYTQSGTVYDTDSIDSLKDDLVVTAHYSDSSTQTVPAADYTLSGTLTAGTSTITVSYGDKTATFEVSVDSATIFEWDYTDGTDNIVLGGAGTAELQNDGVYLAGGSSAWSIGSLKPNISPFSASSGSYKITFDYTDLYSNASDSTPAFFAYNSDYPRTYILRQESKPSNNITRINSGSAIIDLNWQLSDAGTLIIEYHSGNHSVKFIQGSYETTIQAVSNTGGAFLAYAQTGNTASRTAHLKIQHIRIEWIH